jgi:hypothetical protein
MSERENTYGSVETNISDDGFEGIEKVMLDLNPYFQTPEWSLLVAASKQKSKDNLRNFRSWSCRGYCSSNCCYSHLFWTEISSRGPSR